MFHRYAMVAAVIMNPAAGAAGTGEAGMILDDIREAVHPEALARNEHSILVTGRSEMHGVPGQYTFLFDRRGRFVRRVDSPLGETTAFDGRRGWGVDWTGMPMTLELADLEYPQFVAWVHTGRWLLDDAPVDVNLESSNGGPVTLHLRHRAGRARAELDIDPATRLPVRLRHKSAMGFETWEFSEYRDVLGVMMAGRLTQKTDLMSQVFTIEEAGSDTSGSYEPREVRPDDVTFDPGAPARLEVKRAPTGHVLVRPRLNGVSKWFILDTGAGQSVVDAGLADTLGLPEAGRIVLGSIFGAELRRIHRADSLELGPIRMASPILVDMDLSPFTPALGEEVGGVIGYDLLSRAVVEIELRNDLVALHDPGAYALPRGEWQEVFLSQRLPAVPGAFEGGRGLFRLDVGASGGPHGNVIFHTPAVDAFRLLEGRETTPDRIMQYDTALGRIGWFELAGHRFEQPEVVFARCGDGPMSDEFTAGNIGVGFLQAFRIVLDYPKKRIALLELE